MWFRLYLGRHGQLPEAHTLQDLDISILTYSSVILEKFGAAVHV